MTTEEILIQELAVVINNVDADKMSNDGLEEYYCILNAERLRIKREIAKREEKI